MTNFLLWLCQLSWHPISTHLETARLSPLWIRVITGNALTWCGLTFVTLHNVDSKRLYSNNGTWMNMQSVLVAWWQSKSAEPLLSTRQMTMEDWWNEDNHFHRSVQDGYHKKPACQSSVHRATKLLHSKPRTFTVVKKLQDSDSVVRIHFCNWFCDALYSGDISPSLTFFYRWGTDSLK